MQSLGLRGAFQTGEICDRRDCGDNVLIVGGYVGVGHRRYTAS